MLMPCAPITNRIQRRTSTASTSAALSMSSASPDQRL